MDNRKEITPGDFFNITRPTNGNEVWDGQNRFQTCQLKEIRNGLWVYKELWYEYSSGDYPFLSSEITGNIYNENALKCLFEKIQDPEKQGFKSTKLFLPALIERRIKKLKNQYNNISRLIILDVISEKDVTDRANKMILDLMEVSAKLKTNGDNDANYQYDGYVDALLGDYKSPFVSVPKKGPGWNFMGHFIGQATGSISRVFIASKEIELNIQGTLYGLDYYVFPIECIVPNEKLYPIDFALVHPYSSVFQNCECESLAARILYFTQSWDSPLTWERYYETMTQSDKNASESVKRDFDRVAPYLKNPDTCALFSGAWASVSKRLTEQ